ncbi:malonyl-CoA decarboxylase [Caenispirillum salinarum]|uniref:malonyl-CoA decarboxylase n=1 Tax=Caenispirillum salinarum TaxID=859058 RepID=UPI00384ABCDA
MLDLGAVWRDIAKKARLGRSVVERDLEKGGAEVLRQRVEECVSGIGGAVTARARAAEIGRLYLQLSPEGRRRFLVMLSCDFGIDRDAFRKAVEAWEAADDFKQAADEEKRVKQVLDTKRVKLLRQMTSLPDGFKFLVDLRADLLTMLDQEPALLPLEHDFQGLLTSWFDIGFMSMEQITWRSPAHILEKLMGYEAVHEIRSWADLKNRLESDRRCFAFFHPRMPDEPLIFVQVALVKGLAGNVQALLDEKAPEGDPEKADTAIFYSISSTQPGLRGISLGDFLIKRVVDHLRRELPNITTFSTLSPVPGFRRWLERTMAAGDPDLLTDDEHGKVRGLRPKEGAKGSFKEILETGSWRENADQEAVVKKPLTRLCARYLVEEKRGGDRPLDPVARFHLNNGARLERINWLADTSKRGMKQSHGIMVNYLYNLPDIEKNHEAYNGGQVVTSSAVRTLLKR